MWSLDQHHWERGLKVQTLTDSHGGPKCTSCRAKDGGPRPTATRVCRFHKSCRWLAYTFQLACKWKFSCRLQFKKHQLLSPTYAPPPFGLLCLGVLAEQDWTVESVAGRGGVAEGRRVALAPASWSSLKSSQPLHLQGCRLSGKPLEADTPPPPPTPPQALPVGWGWTTSFLSKSLGCWQPQMEASCLSKNKPAVKAGLRERENHRPARRW